MEKASVLWNRFEKSGKLTDYLDFCRVRRLEREHSSPPPHKVEEGEGQSSL